MVAVANQKGGVAKTTTVASLGAAWSQLGQRVLIVDLDPASMPDLPWLRPRVDRLLGASGVSGEVAVYDAVIETEDGSDLLPATIDLAIAEQSLLTRTGRERLLKLVLEVAPCWNGSVMTTA